MTDMSDSYFRIVRAQTPSRLWVNNPTLAEVGPALAEGAVGCTTNPAYGGGLLKRSPGDVLPIIEECLGASPDDRVVADLVQHRLVASIADRFLPLFEASRGVAGFVSIQGSPESDTDAGLILEEAHAGHAIAQNVAPKIPATLPGFQAFERIVAEGYPSIVTEVFSLAQLVYACETYIRVTDRTGTRPPFFVSPITGIFGDHLARVASADGLQCSPGVIGTAGVAFGRACNDLVEQRAYPVTLLFGGARRMEDFTGLIGALTAATINYSTVTEILAADPAVTDSIHEPTPEAVVSELIVGFADFRAAMDPAGLAPAEFERFGPVQHFRHVFLAGWTGVLEAIAAARGATPAPR